ncbi:MAG: methyltransferase domain-containing protein, partial [Betaproteobacteria bacterium]|nr:methyltransferase domain-containing protein [Betaproteobacteria bacterium]
MVSRIRLRGERARVAAFALALLAGGVHEAAAQFTYDAPFVPSPQVVVDEMLRVAGVGPQDFVVDLGSGDGRILITAATKFGARGMGVELDPNLIIQSEEAARQAGVSDRVKFVEQDLFKTDISAASVVTMYLLPGLNLRLRPRLLELAPGTRVVAHDFSLGEWRPDRQTTIRKNVFLWIVPAKVAGAWRMRLEVPLGAREIEVELRQRYQEIDGIAREKGQLQQPLWEAKLAGERVSFVVVDSADRDFEASFYFEGRAAGGVMEGEYRRGV